MNTNTQTSSIVPKSNKSRISRINRIKRSFAKNIARLTWPKHGFKVVKRSNLLWLLNRQHAVDKSFGIFSDFETAQINFLFSQMKEKGCDAFFDVGANFGLYSLYCAQANVAKEIHSFEPDPRSYAQMQANLYLNKLTDIINLRQLAVSDKEAVLEFSIFADDCAGITKVKEGNTTAETKGFLPSETKKLNATSLDILFPWNNKKIFIKIDVEGHEKAAIKGAEALLKNNDCTLQVEIWPEHFDAITKQLSELGYKPFHQIDVDYYFSKRK